MYPVKIQMEKERQEKGPREMNLRVSQVVGCYKVHKTQRWLVSPKNGHL